MYSYLRSVDTESYLEATDTIETSIRSGLGIVDQLAGSTVPLVIFWMMVGLFVYVVGWFLYRAYAAYKNDLPISGNMIKPIGYDEDKNTQEAFIRIAIRLISLFLLVYWIYMCLTEVLSFSSGLFMESIIDIAPGSIFGIMLAIVTLALSSFVVSVLARCVVMRERVFTK